jgi:hypothetical protein
MWAQEAQTVAPPTLAPEVKAIVAGNRANRERFPFASAKLVKTIARARSVEDALARQWLAEPNPLHLEGHWVTDGNRIRFDVTFPQELADGNRIVVRNKSFEIRRLPKSQQTTVGRVSIDDPWSHFLHGQRMCSSAERDVVEFQGEREINGRNLLVLKTSSSRNGGEPVSYFIDPDRGFLPVRVEKGNRVIIVCDDLHQSRGGWVPRRWICMAVTNDSHKPYYCVAEEVTEWNSEERPGPEVFRVAVTPGETFSYESSIGPLHWPREAFRVPCTEIDLAWFPEDDSLDAPDGALEPVELTPAPTAPTAHTAQSLNETLGRPESWQLAIVLAISVSTGFGCLILFDWFRRRRTAKAEKKQ